MPAITTDADLLTLYKEYYTDKKLQNLFERESPALKVIPKNRVEGKSYNYAMMHGHGGAVSGSYTVTKAAATTRAKIAQASVTPGRLFNAFSINMKEMLASESNRGAFENTVIALMFATLDQSRKHLAGSLYSEGYGELGYLTAQTLSGASTMEVDNRASLLLDVGVQFQIVDDADDPSAAYVAGGPYTVSAINGNTVTFTPVAAANFDSGSIIELQGGRTSTGAPAMPVGLAGWIPFRDNRTGSDWNTYIGTSFFGVTRSSNVNRLAGSFYQRDSGNNETYYSAIENGLRLARRAAGNPKYIFINDEDWKQIRTELTSTQFQMVNSTPEKTSTNEVVSGLTKLQFAFSENSVQYVLDDPLCPKGKAWIVEVEKGNGMMSNVEYEFLTNTA
jgi:hypothetical protein